ncbi:MAG TPA: right-handed parallel beta-helix repeat-containing protein, partial [Polyangia bacterium]|nr:right-handed parallel beta-helix repeat-containing protein [Polyangia bacterium]
GGAAGNACAAGAAGAHYLDATAGNDAGDGTTPATAWKTLDKINATTFQPGDAICLKAGGSWTGQLAPRGSGTAAAPIVIDQYGAGPRPIVAAGAGVTDTVYLMNQQYWEINDLEVTNTKSSPGDLRGISINGQDGGTLNHLYVRNCYVHDVTGVVNWIGGDTADNAPGVTFQTGWDGSKHTGGIVFNVLAGSANVKTKFNDVLVESNTVADCSFGGIVLKQLDGTVHWGTRSSATSSSWTPHTNVTIRGNYVSQLNASLGCNAIYMTDVQNGLIEENVSDGAGTSAIELDYTDSVTIQKNEAFGTKVKAGGADSNGIDTDRGTTKTIIQDNYLHENGDGILICQLGFGDSVIRYNILQNNSRYQIYLHSDPAASSAVYNNTVYNNKTNSGVAYGYGTSLSASYTLRNNIFFAASGNGVLTTSSTIVYQNNLYAGSAIQIPAGDTAAVKADPKLVAPGTGTSGGAAGPAFGSLGGYKLSAGSPAINAGVVISGNGGLDFWGDAITGAPDIGAAESP